MPPKPRDRNLFRDAAKKRPYKTKKKYKMVLLNPMRNLSSLPSRLKTKVSFNWTGLCNHNSAFSTVPFQQQGNDLVNPGIVMATQFTVQGTTGLGTLAPYGLTRLLGSAAASSNAPYGAYRVFGSKMDVTLIPEVPGASFSFCLLAMPSNSIPTNDWEAYVNAPRVNRIGPARLVSLESGTGTRLSGYRSTAQVLGITKQSVRDNDTLAAVWPNGPAAPWVWHICVTKVNDGPIIPGDFTLQVKQTFFIELFALNSIHQTTT